MTPAGGSPAWLCRAWGWGRRAAQDAWNPGTLAGGRAGPRPPFTRTGTEGATRGPRAAEDPLFRAQQMRWETRCHDCISQNANAIFIKYTSTLRHMFDVLPPTEAVK